MSETQTEQPLAEPIRLSANCIVAGKFIRARDPTPYEREEDLPEALKAFATDEEKILPPPQRNIYDHMQPPLRRQARRRGNRCGKGLGRRGRK